MSDFTKKKDGVFVNKTSGQTLHREIRKLNIENKMMTNQMKDILNRLSILERKINLATVTGTKLCL